MLKILHHLPMGHECFRALFKRCTHEELRAWAKTLPWDHPIARKLDHEVHRRRMAGKSHLLLFSMAQVWGPSYPLFFLIHRRVPGDGFSPKSLVPVHLCRCPRRARFNWAARFWVPRTCRCFRFFDRFLGVHGKPTRVPYLPVGRPSHPWRNM